MQFENTETFKNLARSFAGESQAGMRYQLTAKIALKEGYKTLSDAIKTIAKNETYHAKRFFETLLEKAGSKENIVLDAGYPFHGGSLIDGLRFAALDEKSESTEIYPKFAETAEKEGFKDVAALYRMVSEVEKQHNIIFNYLYDAVKNGTLYKCETPMVWICSECGYMHVGTEAWKICPLCKADQGHVELHLPFEGVRK
ncbi:MAG: rubrerythrin family protein [Clostridia bacterium]|nr:rubrerythrin family protein [Clostridia bacterium]